METNKIEFAKMLGLTSYDLRITQAEIKTLLSDDPSANIKREFLDGKIKIVQYVEDLEDIRSTLRKDYLKDAYGHLAFRMENRIESLAAEQYLNAIKKAATTFL